VGAASGFAAAIVAAYVLTRPTGLENAKSDLVISGRRFD
jgi:hypothetical protein